MDSLHLRIRDEKHQRLNKLARSKKISAIAHHLRSFHWWSADKCADPLLLSLAKKIKEWFSSQTVMRSLYSAPNKILLAEDSIALPTPISFLSLSINLLTLIPN